jgi:hypothetical protein
MRWWRLFGTSWVAALATVAACSSSYVTKGVADAGEAGSDDASDDSGDGGSCVMAETMTLPKHGGPACPSDAGCFPGDVTGFSPSWVPPYPGSPHAGLCTQTQISDALKDCIDGATENNQACQTWLGQSSSNPTCYACLVTDWTAKNYGAAIKVGGILSPNFPSCIALAEPCNQPCAEAQLAWMMCKFNACNPVLGPCEATDQASYQANLACESQAETTCGCAAYKNVAVSCAGALQGAASSHPAIADCDGLDMTNFDAAFTAVAGFMCGK